MEIKKLFVVGAGAMGAGIGQLASQKGITAYIMDINAELVEKAKQRISKGLLKRIEKGKITQEDMDDVLSRMNWTTKIEDAADCDFVIEAAYEDINVKKDIFQKLSKICRKETIFATNTTALSISEIGSSSDRPDKVIGMHFFNPPVIMKLVEIIRGDKTSDETIAKAKSVTEFFGKTPIITKKEAPAGIVSRVLAGMLNEAVRVYADGISEPQDIDNAMKLGAGVPMGPLALIDMIGLDIHVAKMNTLYEKLQDEIYKPHDILIKMVNEGKLGKKSGQGFYTY